MPSEEAIHVPMGQQGRTYPIGSWKPASSSRVEPDGGLASGMVQPETEDSPKPMLTGTPESTRGPIFVVHGWVRAHEHFAVFASLAVKYLGCISTYFK